MCNLLYYLSQHTTTETGKYFIKQRQNRNADLVLEKTAIRGNKENKEAAHIRKKHCL